MADKAKFTPEIHQLLKETYQTFVEEAGGKAKITIELNRAFGAYARADSELEPFTDAQMRGSLVTTTKAWIATNPRTEPKKKGVTKAELVKTLNDALGDAEINNGMKLTLSDLEILIAALTSELVE